MGKKIVCFIMLVSMMGSTYVPNINAATQNETNVSLTIKEPATPISNKPSDKPNNNTTQLVGKLPQTNSQITPYVSFMGMVMLSLAGILFERNRRFHHE